VVPWVPVLEPLLLDPTAGEPIPEGLIAEDPEPTLALPVAP